MWNRFAAQVIFLHKGAAPTLPPAVLRIMDAALVRRPRCGEQNHGRPNAPEYARLLLPRMPVWCAATLRQRDRLLWYDAVPTKCGGSSLLMDQRTYMGVRLSFLGQPALTCLGPASHETLTLATVAGNAKFLPYGTLFCTYRGDGGSYAVTSDLCGIPHAMFPSTFHTHYILLGYQYDYTRCSTFVVCGTIDSLAKLLVAEFCSSRIRRYV